MPDSIALVAKVCRSAWTPRSGSPALRSVWCKDLVIFLPSKGVPNSVQKTRSLFVHSGPAANRISSCSRRCAASSSFIFGGRGIILRPALVFGVLVSRNVLHSALSLKSLFLRIKGTGGTPIPFLTSNKYFQGVLVGSDLWKGLGWGAITYIAAIQGVDTSLYEAATMDGCGRFRQIWHITLPGIRRIFVVLMILKVGKILDAGFGQVYVMMNDSVRASGEIIDTWIYTQGLGKLNYSLSTAVGLLKSVISFVLVFATNKLARKWECAIW